MKVECFYDARSEKVSTFLTLVVLFLVASYIPCYAENFKAKVGFEGQEVDFKFHPGRSTDTFPMPAPNDASLSSALPVPNPGITAPSANFPQGAAQNLTPGNAPVIQKDGFNLPPGWGEVAWANDLKNNGRVAIRDITFDYNSATIKSESNASLEKIAYLLRFNPTIKILIEGHTDSTGDPASNMTLSEQRAESVKTWLTNNGINGSRLRTVGMGDTKPVADNGSEDGRAQNRRVELVKE